MGPRGSLQGTPEASGGTRRKRFRHPMHQLRMFNDIGLRQEDEYGYKYDGEYVLEQVSSTSMHVLAGTFDLALKD